MKHIVTMTKRPAVAQSEGIPFLISIVSLVQAVLQAVQLFKETRED